MKLKFTKIHGLGNDYIYIDCLRGPTPEDPVELARKMCRRHFGVGSDGMVLILPSEIADLRARIFNPDGSEAEMSGNGIRGLGKFAYERGLVEKENTTVHTPAGIKEIYYRLLDGKVESMRVDMGSPSFQRKDIPMLGPPGEVKGEPLKVDGQKHLITAVNIGNPHCVLFPEIPVEKFPLDKVGPAIEHHPSFPERTNVEIVNVLSSGEIKMRIWERGAEETLASGTGASAAVLASAFNSFTNRLVKVHLAGGDLQIEWTDENKVYLTGPATVVFDGEYFCE